jgi:hypothetical protein
VSRVGALGTAATPVPRVICVRFAQPMKVAL